MTHPMTTTTIVAALLAVLATEASAQSRSYYNASGRVVGRSTDSSGTVTNDARGRVISRKSTSGNTTTVYDAAEGMSEGSRRAAESVTVTDFKSANFVDSKFRKFRFFDQCPL